MQTRSQTKYDNLSIYEVNIDFDGASEAWKANKKSIGNGSYKRSKNNNCCICKCLPGEDYCKTHIKMFNQCKF
jgi:hypothetical protein